LFLCKHPVIYQIFNVVVCKWLQWQFLLIRHFKLHITKNCCWMYCRNLLWKGLTVQSHNSQRDQKMGTEKSRKLGKSNFKIFLFSFMIYMHCWRLLFDPIQTENTRFSVKIKFCEKVFFVQNLWIWLKSPGLICRDPS
jgi:hypothetical protein